MSLSPISGDAKAIISHVQKLIDEQENGSAAQLKKPKVDLEAQPHLHALFSNLPISIASPNLTTIHYVLSNEKNQSQALQQLANAPKRNNAIHLGFSCWFNFDIISTREPSLALLCDIDPEMIALLNLIRSITINSNNRADFMDSFWGELRSREHLNFAGLLGIKGMIQFDEFRTLVTAQGWLSSEESFLIIKNMYLEGRIAHSKLDITDSTVFQDLKNWADKTSLSFDTIYDSNIPEWLFQRNRQKLNVAVENCNSLSDVNTLFISAWKKNPNQGNPILRLQTGSHPKLEYITQKKTKQATNRLLGPAPKNLFF